MKIEEQLMQRCQSSCELCSANEQLTVYHVTGSEQQSDDSNIVICSLCHDQITGAQELNVNHWHCLRDSMWSQVPGVQVMAWRLLTKLSAEAWAQDLLDMLYLDEALRNWAMADAQEQATNEAPTLDCNETELQEGDTVTIIKDLVVKGAGFTAKRGTAVRNIHLTSNPEQIEGRVNGTRIVLLTCYLKKS